MSEPAIPTPTTRGPLAVALLYDGLCSFEFGIVAEIFGLERPELGPHWYRFASCPVEAGPLRTQTGLWIQAPDQPGLLTQADLIIVPGWKSIHAEVPADLCQSLRAAYQRGAKLISICSGAAVLAATGLLDGAEVATHWRYAEALQRRFPALRVNPRQLYREHRGIHTSAGSAAGIDLLLEIVRQDFGAEAANSVARRLVLPARREGGQAPYLQHPPPTRRAGRLTALLEQIRRQPAEPWDLASMAASCAMSQRHFARRFFEATGETPGRWLIAERLELAKHHLTDPELSMEQVAGIAGFGSAHTLRHHFRRQTGLSPSAWRAQRMPAPSDRALRPGAD